MTGQSDPGHTGQGAADALRTEDRPVLFFDGVCGICDGFVGFLIERDTQERFLFAPLQGDTAASRGLSMEDWRAAAIVLEADGQRLEGADAVMEVLLELGGALAVIARVGRLVPRPLRDALYRFVAERRYGWFGVKDECRIPTPEERARFLP